MKKKKKMMMLEQTCHKGRLVCDLQPNIALARIVFAEVDGEVRFLKLTKLSLDCSSCINTDLRAEVD